MGILLSFEGKHPAGAFTGGDLSQRGVNKQRTNFFFFSQENLLLETERTPQIPEIFGPWATLYLPLGPFKHGHQRRQLLPWPSGCLQLPVASHHTQCFAFTHRSPTHPELGGRSSSPTSPVLISFPCSASCLQQITSNTQKTKNSSQRVLVHAAGPGSAGLWGPLAALVGPQHCPLASHFHCGLPLDLLEIKRWTELPFSPASPQDSHRRHQWKPQFSASTAGWRLFKSPFLFTPFGRDASVKTRQYFAVNGYSRHILQPDQQTSSSEF